MHKPAFYRLRAHPPLVLTNANHDTLSTLQNASKQVLATRPHGISTHEYVARLVTTHKIRVSDDAAELRKLVAAIPDVAYIGRGPVGGSLKTLVYPAYAQRLCKRRRSVEDYDVSTLVGETSVRQLRDITAMLLGKHPRGLLATTYIQMLRPYGHNIEIELAKELAGRFPEVAQWDPAPIYSEFDAVRRPNPGPGPQRTRRLPNARVNQERRVRREAAQESFLKWYDDVFPQKAKIGQARDRSPYEGVSAGEGEAEASVSESGLEPPPERHS